uniref:Formamidopyrimidine-DNA glycosylase catalytic domain-containing protein n=1 Tax=Zea mays TaxID=4577 RepID=A0A804PXJ5_MAIZE
MPELPEVEAARRALQAHCVGRRIARCAVADDAKVVVAAAGRAAFERAMVGRTIVAARRRGKNLWLQLDAPPFPSFQFGMAGAIYIKGIPVTNYKRSVVNSEEEWPSKHSKFFAELDDGPDALFEPMSVDSFLDSLGRKKIGIKALLLDQSFISGIGNWIADEVLYQSRIHPLQIASNLPRESCEALHQSIEEVVKYAVEVDADMDRFPKEWLFHHRWGKKPGKVDGKKIEFITAGGRTTAYVPQLQKLVGTQSSKTISVAENGDAKDSGTEGEDADADVLKPRKRAATSRGQRNKDTAGSRKARGNGADAEAAEPATGVVGSNSEQAFGQANSDAVDKSDRATRRSSRKVKARK